MNPTGKALWFIESHFASELTLEDVAGCAGVSRYHMTRAFEAATGYSIMRYVRARRLSEAARSLAHDAPDILSVALQAGYNSHEAFTRAFREQFGATPEEIRDRRGLTNIELVEPIKMDETPVTNLEPSRFEDCRTLLIGGLGERYTCETSAAIPAQWQRFVPHIGHIPGQIGAKAYGVCSNFDNAGNFDYLCGVEVSDWSNLPKQWSRIRIPEQRYVVFAHRGHVSGIRGTWSAIWNKWLPESGDEAADAPNFECYAEDFDSQTGMGGIEIWLPLKR